MIRKNSYKIKIMHCFAGILGIIMLSACGSTAPELAAEDQDEVETTDQETDETVTFPAQKELELEEFWDFDDNKDAGSFTFCTGLEIIFPEEWTAKTITDTDFGPVNNPTSNTLMVCEKTNAEANAGGTLFSLSFLKYDEAAVYEIFPVDTVLGLYRQGEEVYALILQLPREMNYVEGNEEMREAYEKLSGTVDEVLINTDNMPDFTKCGIDDVEWITLYTVQ